MIQAHFVGDKIVSSSSLAFTFYDKSRWGEKKNGRIEYSPIEAVYLVSSGKMNLFSGKNELGEDSLTEKLKKKDKKIETKFAVFRDLRNKGYIVKSALKFGAEFRVYAKGVKPGEDHADWILQTVRESDKLNWHEFSAKSRVAHSTRKKLLLGIVDDEGDVTYYEAGWTRL